MFVQPMDGRSVPVRNQKLPNGKNCRQTLCERYPNCYYGDMCQFAHGQEELDYWEGMHTLCSMTLCVTLEK